MKVTVTYIQEEWSVETVVNENSRKIYKKVNHLHTTESNLKELIIISTYGEGYK